MTIKAFLRYDFVATIALLMLALLFNDFLAVWRVENLSRMQWVVVDTAMQTFIALWVISPLFNHPFFKGRLWRWIFVAGAAIILLDVDHFIFAGSMTLEAAASLPERPFTHSLTFALACGLLAWLVTRRGEIGWLLFAALSAHVLHDVRDFGAPFLWPLEPELLPGPIYYTAQASLCVLSALIAAWPSRLFLKFGAFGVLQDLVWGRGEGE